MIHRYEALNWSISNMAVRKLDSNEAVYTQFRYYSILYLNT